MGDGEDLVELVQGHAAPIAAVLVDGAVQFAPQRMGRVDAEVAADVGEDGADGLTAHLGGDLVWCGQLREMGIYVGGLDLGLGRRRRLGIAPERAARRAPVRCRGFGLGFGVEAAGGAADLILEEAGALQALCDAREDDGDVTDAEIADQVGRVGGGGGALAESVGEVLAIVDEPADEAEQAAGAARWG